MRLTTYTNYALRTLMYCALRGEKLTRVQDIANAYNISNAHLIKAAHQLGRLGFLENVRGRSGGIRLAMPANRIVVGEVVRHTEGDMELVECFIRTTNTCPLIDICRLSRALKQARQAFLDVLDELTIADLTANRTQLTATLFEE